MAKSKEAESEAPAASGAEGSSGFAPLSLVRQHRASGKIEARPRGRKNPEYEYGYIDASGEFQVGEPAKTGKRGRKKGSGRGRKAAAQVEAAPAVAAAAAEAAPAAPAAAPAKRGRKKGSVAKVAGGNAGLSMIENIVQSEVDKRVKVALESAIAALHKSLGV